MLSVDIDKTRKEEDGQIFVELISNRDLRDFSNNDRLGYWCDKAHLNHFITGCARFFTENELIKLLNINMKKIEIEIPDGKRAEWVNGVLTLVDEKPKDITERVKSYEDACEVIGELPWLNGGKLVIKSEDYYGAKELPDHVRAMLKLETVVRALNEGWQPKFTKDECRWYPWFYQYTKKELDDMSQEEKDERCIIDVSDRNAGYYAGFAFAYSHYAPSTADANLGSRLCLKSDTLAVYCGKQFINLWADYLLRRK